MTDAHAPLQDATPEDLHAAVAANHRAYFGLCAAATGGVLHEHDGVAWIEPGPGGTPAILFPALAPVDAGPTIDRLIQLCCARDVAGLVGWWSLDPPQPADLELRLLARGFQLGWRPRWMVRDLDLPLAERALPAKVRIALLDNDPPQDVADLPFYDAAAAVDAALSRQRPQRVWAFGAWDGAQLVGRVVLCLSNAPLGVAGLYDVGVAPAARDQGIGAALTAAACRQARERGYRYAVLNATGDGERMYRRLGFAHLGDGRTWWLNVSRLAANPPSPERIALVEAVGRGDLPALRALAPRLPAATWDQPLPNGMTLLQLAAHTVQLETAAWLVDHAGATLDVTPGWALGWHDRVATALRVRPELANRRIGEQQTTPLHDAVQQGDARLVRLLLDAEPDLALTDGTFHATSLAWARHLGRVELAQVIEARLTG